MSDNPAQDWVIRQVQAHGLEPVLFALVIVGGAGFVAGASIVWWRNQKKTEVETQKLGLENKKTAGEIMKHLADNRAVFVSERQLFDLSLGQMRDSLLADKDGKKTPTELRSSRDEMCSIYSNRYLPALVTYSECIAAEATQVDARVRAQTELMPGLKTMCRFLDVVNMEAMLKKCESAAFKLRRESRDGLFERVAALIPWWRFRLHWQVHKLRSRTNPHLRSDD